MPAVYSTDGLDEIKELEKTGKYRSVWGSFVISPKNVHFESQDDEEKIMFLGRRHIITNLGWIALVCFALFVPLFWFEFPMVKELSDNVLLGMTLMWYLGLFIFSLQNFLLWFYNVYIVTNERMIDVDFMGMLYKNVSVTQITNIEDVNYVQKGVLAGFLNYGDVIIRTASERMPSEDKESSPFTFEKVSNPDKIVQIISELMQQQEHEHSGGRSK